MLADTFNWIDSMSALLPLPFERFKKVGNILIASQGKYLYTRSLTSQTWIEAIKFDSKVLLLSHDTETNDEIRCVTEHSLESMVLEQDSLRLKKKSSK